MANISQIKVGNTTYDIEDSVARAQSASLSADVKEALLACFEKVAWISNDGQDYYDALVAALYPPTNLTSITCVYTQSGTVYDINTLDSLKSDLVVTAHYSDSTTETITSYTLSGTLTVGTSTITVSYGGKTDTFTVTVSTMYPSGAVWTYESSSGNTLTSYSNYVTDASNIPSGQTVSETITNGLLKVYASAPSGQSNVYKRWNFADQSTTNGKIVATVKFDNLQNSSDTGFRLQLSNGTSGAQLFVESVDTSYTGIQVTYYKGTTATTTAIPNAGISDMHTISIELANGKQIGTFDGVELFNESTLSSNYATRNSILVQAASQSAGADGITVSIQKIAYYEAS